MTVHTVLQPEGWAAPKGYVNGVVARGRHVFVAGQIGWNAQGRFESDDLSAQFRQTLANVVAVLAEAGAEPAHLVRLTIYVTDMEGYRAAQREIGRAWREVLGRNFPPAALVQVIGLVEPRAKVEIEATAVVPE